MRLSYTIMCILIVMEGFGAQEKKLWEPCTSTSCRKGTIVKLLVPEHGLPIGQLTQVVEKSSGPLLRIEDPTPLERDDLWISREELGRNPLWEAIEAGEKEKKRKIEFPTRPRFAETSMHLDDDDEDDAGAEDDYMTPYFKKDKFKFTYFDYDNFGTSPSQIDKMRMDKATQDVMKYGAKEVLTLDSDAKSILRKDRDNEKAAEKQAAELAKLEARQELKEITKCKFRCQKKMVRTRMLSFPTTHQMCIEKETSNKWKELYQSSRISTWYQGILFVTFQIDFFFFSQNE